MSSGLTSNLSEFSRNSEFTRNPLAGDGGNRAPRKKTSFMRKIMAWPGKLVSSPRRLLSSAFARYLLAFLLGAAAMGVWGAYGNIARQKIASWSPRLAFIAPKHIPNVRTR